MVQSSQSSKAFDASSLLIMIDLMRDPKSQQLTTTIATPTTKNTTTSKTTTISTTTTTTTKTTTKTTTIDCNKGTYFAHLTDCKKFIQCDNGYPVVKDCAAGTAWSNPITTCDFIANVPSCK